MSCNQCQYQLDREKQQVRCVLASVPYLSAQWAQDMAVLLSHSLFKTCLRYDARINSIQL